MTDSPRRAEALKAYYALSLLLFIFFPLICRLGFDGNLPPQKAFPRFWINLIFLNALAAYALLFIRKGKDFVLSRKEWILFALVGIALCTTPPIFSGDLHEYLMRGRILGVYHENPYLVPHDFPNDPFYPLTVWVGLHKLPENYGPVWALTQCVMPTIFRDSYFLSVFSFKLFMMLFMAGSVWLFHRICRKVSPANAGWLTAFYALNPNLLNQTLVDGHNDIVMVFWILCGFYLLLTGRYFRAVAAATLAVLVKFTTVFFLAAMGLFRFRHCEKKGIFDFLLLTAKSSALMILICAAFYSPFWTGERTLSYFTKFGEWFATNSVPYAVHWVLNRAGAPVSEPFIKTFFNVFFLINCAAALLWISFKEELDVRSLCRAVSWIFLAMYASYTIPFYGHHLLWALPFLILAAFPAPVLWSTLYSVVGLFFYFKRPSFLYLAGFAVYGAYLAWRTYFGCKSGSKEPGFHR